MPSNRKIQTITYRIYAFSCLVKLYLFIYSCVGCMVFKGRVYLYLYQISPPVLFLYFPSLSFTSISHNILPSDLEFSHIKIHEMMKGVDRGINQFAMTKIIPREVGIPTCQRTAGVKSCALMTAGTS